MATGVSKCIMLIFILFNSRRHNHGNVKIKWNCFAAKDDRGPAIAGTGAEDVGGVCASGAAVGSVLRQSE